MPNHVHIVVVPREADASRRIFRREWLESMEKRSGLSIKPKKRGARPKAVVAA
jgi:hypothetical protein